MKNIKIDRIPRDFSSASNQVIQYLKGRFGFQLWMVTRVEGDHWIVLHAEDHGYGVKSGDVFSWADSFCSRMVKGLGPCIATDSNDVQSYLEAPIGQQVEIRAYVGLPMYQSNGELFGTLCAIDPEPQPEGIMEDEDTLKLLAGLLNTVLNTELDLQHEKRRAEHAEYQSERDALTKLFNRRGWDKLLEIEESRCRRYGSTATVISVDLDNLKHTNDTEGHYVGDKLLIETGYSLLEIARPSDIVARVGGDEFLMLVLDCDQEGAQHLLKRVNTALLRKGISASVGYGVRLPNSNLVSAWKESDKNMYRAKRSQKVPEPALKPC